MTIDTGAERLKRKMKRYAKKRDREQIKSKDKYNVKKQAGYTTERSVAGLIEFFEAALNLKSVKRSGWIEKVHVTNPESVADHSFSMSAASMLLADVLGLEVEKTLRMAILHDIAESITGDYMPEEIASGKKLAIERKAIGNILAGLPPKIRMQYRNIWEEYAAGKSPVARLVHAIDKFEMSMQAEYYAKQGYSDKLLEQFFNSARLALVGIGQKVGGGNAIEELLAAILAQHFKAEQWKEH